MLWTAGVVIVGSILCLVLMIFSVALGFTFFIVPILVAELMLLAAVGILRRAFGAYEEGEGADRRARTNRGAWKDRLAWYWGAESSRTRPLLEEPEVRPDPDGVSWPRRMQ